MSNTSDALKAPLANNSKELVYRQRRKDLKREYKVRIDSLIQNFTEKTISGEMSDMDRKRTLVKIKQLAESYFEEQSDLAIMFDQKPQTIGAKQDSVSQTFATP